MLTWSDFLGQEKTVFSPERDRFICTELEHTIEHRRDIRFFCKRLSSDHMWRLFGEFRNSVAFLDIETSGGYQGTNDITIIGVYDGDKVYTFISGKNLYDFEQAIAGYDLVVTFSGSTFDLPMIRRQFPNISLPPAHIDLRFLLKQLGYKGGLKKIEKTLGIGRNSKIEGMNGYHAVMLWKAYQWGDDGALDQLIEYNTADIVNLKPLMEIAYDEMKTKMLRGYIKTSS